MLLLSRFWYLILATIAAIAIAAALLAQGIINRQSDSQVGVLLRRDRVELDAVLSLEARSRLDNIAFITVESQVGAILRKARNIDDTNRLIKLSAELKDTLNEHFKRRAEAAPGGGTADQKLARVKPAIAIAVDSEGRIIAQTGPLTANPPGSSLATFPLIKRTLQGYVRDDVWVYDRYVYRMAGRPIIHGGQYVGAIAHGYRIDAPFVETLSKSVGGASVAFFYGSTVLSSHVPSEVAGAPTREQIAASIPKALGDESFKKGECTEPITLQGGGLAVYSLVRGGAAEAQVGYAIARPRKLLTSPEQLFDSATDSDVDNLPKAQLIGGAVLLFLLGLVWLFFEHDRPFRQLVKKTGQIARNERDRLIITEWRTWYRKLADAINQAIDREVEKAAEMIPGTRKKVDLDEILGPTPEVAGADPFFGFSGEHKVKQSAENIPAPPPPSVEKESQERKSPPLPPPPPIEQTASQLKSPAPSAPTAEDFDEEVHFKEVFEQYLSTRKECGESTEGMSYEKFAVTLRKNSDQIISKHDAKAVRFTVYVKQGKASLKASPIKK